MAKVENLIAIYSVIVIAVAAISIALVIVAPPGYDDTQLYPKEINTSSALNPYDRGGIPFEKADVQAQYPENSPNLGYVTAYLTPLSALMALTNDYLGTTIVSHPGGIIDEILYNTRGLDTIVETSILFIAFAIASFLFRREEE